MCLFVCLCVCLVVSVSVCVCLHTHVYTYLLVLKTCHKGGQRNYFITSAQRYTGRKESQQRDRLTEGSMMPAGPPIDGSKRGDSYLPCLLRARSCCPDPLHWVATCARPPHAGKPAQKKRRHGNELPCIHESRTVATCTQPRLARYPPDLLFLLQLFYGVACALNCMSRQVVNDQIVISFAVFFCS